MARTRGNNGSKQGKGGADIQISTNLAVNPTGYAAKILVTIPKYPTAALQILESGSIIFTGAAVNGLAEVNLQISGHQRRLLQVKVLASDIGQEKSAEFALPYPAQLDLAASAAQANGAWRVNLTAKVRDTEGNPRPHAVVTIDGPNGQIAQGATNCRGVFTATDVLPRSRQNDTVGYKAYCNKLEAKAESRIPLPSRKPFRLEKRLDASPNLKYNKGEAGAFTLKTILLFGGMIFLIRYAGLAGHILAPILIGAIIAWQVNRWPFFFGLAGFIAGLVLYSSLEFAAWGVLLGLTVYWYEAWSRPIDPDTRKGLKHPLNPYPKWLIGIGLFFFLISAINPLRELFLGSAVEIDEIITIGESNGFVWDWVWKDSAEDASGKLATELFFSPVNWLVYLIIQSAYALPGETLEYFTRVKSSGTEVVGILAALNEFWKFLIRSFKKIRGVGK